jgi:hypothetical protein
MTLTERKRHKFPKRYIRKDARTRIYRELYGMADAQKGRRSNIPVLDETRRFNTFWSHQEAESIYKHYVDDAQFTKAERNECDQRLEQLKRFKPHEA